MKTAIFRSTSAYDGPPGYADRSGEKVKVLRELNDKEYDRSPNGDDLGPMYQIQFADGTRTHAFGDELTIQEGTLG